MHYPADLKYTKDHTWIRVEGEVVCVGITDYAQSEIGRIKYVDIPAENITLDREDVFGSIEAEKIISDLYMPISGKIIEVNRALENEPELINESPYDAGWLLKVHPSDATELNGLLSLSHYQQFIGTL
ncbi:MAG: glycine cleavage system protein GcvH [Tannerella sp.]|jgi:glycine cleavage system H protein|nr:glycine cleavage system protein GcvH [Tannerella sp.]